MAKNKNTKPNSYSARLGRRKSATKIRVSLPATHDFVTANGTRFPMPTLNPAHFTYHNEGGALKLTTHVFERLPRSEEL